MISCAACGSDQSDGVGAQCGETCEKVELRGLVLLGLDLLVDSKFFVGRTQEASHCVASVPLRVGVAFVFPAHDNIKTAHAPWLFVEWVGPVLEGVHTRS